MVSSTVFGNCRLDEEPSLEKKRTQNRPSIQDNCYTFKARTKEQPAQHWWWSLVVERLACTRLRGPSPSTKGNKKTYITGGSIHL